MRVVGIYRDKRFSPASVENDRMILRQTLERFAEDGADVTAIDEETILERGELPEGDLYLAMARTDTVLDLLNSCKARVVNSPEGIRLCNRCYLLENILRDNGIPTPPPDGEDGVWLKRGDGCAQVAEDTVYCRSEEEISNAMADFKRRGIEHVVRQAHITGDLVKFYGVGGTDFFHTLYPTDLQRSKFGCETVNGKAHHYAYDQKALKACADRIAELTGVTVYGGDAIIKEDGRFLIIDFNDWPTFSPCRDAAAKSIKERVCRAYIFDYGGTLDSCGDHWGKVIWHAYERVGVPVTWEEFRDAYVHAERTLGRNRIIMPNFTFRDTLATKLRIQLERLVEQGCIAEEWMMAKDALLSDLYSRVQTTVEHSRRVLEELRREGAQMVLVSNFYGNVNTVLREFRLDGLFLSVVESAVVGIRKPDARIFSLGVEALRKACGARAEEITVVGDSLEKDIVPAKSIGCRTAWFKGEPWEEHDDCDSNAGAADFIINNLEEIRTKTI